MPSVRRVKYKIVRLKKVVTKEKKMSNLISRNGLSPRRVDLFSEVSRELDHVFNEVFAAPFFAGKKSKGYPLLDAIRSDKKLTLQYTVPGVKPEDLDVEVTKDEQGKIVTVSGKLSVDYSHKEDNYAIRELSSREFRRVIRLPEDVTDEEPDALLKDGILKLVFNTSSKEQEVQQVKKLRIKSE
jgi:HSP20 family protein